MVDIRKTIENFQSDTHPYTIIGICKDCGGQRRILLVPPRSMKFDIAPPLSPLLNDARTAFESAEVIVAVGFSFEADVYIARMLSKAVQTSKNQRLVIVDPDSSVVERVAKTES